MKAEEWLTYFMKIYGRRPKMTEVDEAIQNGSLLANRAEVEALLPVSKKGFWESLSQFVATHKVVASIVAVFCVTLLGGGGNSCLAFSQLTNPKATIPHGGLI